MDKPRRFFHYEVREELYQGVKIKSGYLHAGRVEMSMEAFVLFWLAVLGGLFVTQLVLGFTTGWTEWWPGKVVLVALVLGVAFTFVKWVIQFLMYIASEIKINKPGE
ncbi:membrane protein [Microbacterium phage Big4]|nr:membrane protein [Microbacterium phage Big4]